MCRHFTVQLLQSLPLKIAVGLVWITPILAGCGNDLNPQETGSFICTNTLTGLCEPCPGVAVCIDPNTCLLRDCLGKGDILFGTDSGASDMGSGDGANADADQDGVDGEADDGSADVGIVDGEAGDTGAGDTGAGDTGAGDTGAGGTCVDGATKCAGGTSNVPQQCKQGQWQNMAACGAGFVCASGACTCAKECLALGQKSCISGVSAVKTCQLDNACLRWGVPLACQSGQVCESGQCKAKSSCSPACPAGKVCQQGVCVVPNCAPACSGGKVCEQGVCVTPTCTPACAGGKICSGGSCVPAAVGTLECSQIMACVNQFSQGPKDTITINACIAKGNAAAQTEYTKRKNCIALSCQTLIDAGKGNEAMLCVYTYCAKEQSGCLGSGIKSCSGLAGCLTSCGNSVTCLLSCHADTSVAGVKDWYLLGTCGEQKCPGKSGNTYATCVTQACPIAFQSCFGATGGGTYSCGQVLKCAGSCGTKSCANNCKAKASSAGLASLNALLACNSGPCGAVCGGAASTQCSTCMATKCGAQQAACQ